MSCRTTMPRGTAKARTTRNVIPTLSTTMRRRTSVRAVLGRDDQLHTDAAHAEEVSRLGGCLSQLAAQPGQVHIDRAVAAAPGELPDVGEKLALRDDLARPSGERGKQVELLAGELDASAVESRLPAHRVDDQPADDDRCLPRLVAAARASQEGADARVDLRRRERLHDVVVGA